jgi:peptidoglycan/xylan/chitin deacetylase (PgdA/CDA1 family)
MTVRHLMLTLIARSGFARLARAVLVGRGRFILELHGVASRRYPELAPQSQPSFCADDLRALLAWLDGRFAFLTPDELLAGDSPGVLLTFDDGCANNATVALPILREYGASAVFFVATQHVEDPSDWLPATRRVAAAAPGTEIARDLYDGMSVAELREASADPLVTIGAHTVHHPFLTRLGDDELADELALSKSFLEEKTGRVVDLFAYPTNDYDRRVALAVRAAGYRAAFVEDSRDVGMEAYEIPRVGLYSAENDYLSVKLSGLHRRPLGATLRL